MATTEAHNCLEPPPGLTDLLRANRVQHVGLIHSNMLITYARLFNDKYCILLVTGMNVYTILQSYKHVQIK